jgi:hypothetical protein
MYTMPEGSAPEREYHPIIVGTCIFLAIAAFAALFWHYKSPVSIEQSEHDEKTRVLQELAASSEPQLSPEQRDTVLVQLDDSGNAMTGEEKDRTMRALQTN